MKIRRKFSFYSLMMFLLPVLAIAAVSVVFLIIFIMKFPVEELSLSRAALLNPVILIRAFGQFFRNHPEAAGYVLLWLLICVVITGTATVTITGIMARSIEKPINELIESVGRIQKGELGFEVAGSEYDEINELCEGFDKMRGALMSARIKETEMKDERSRLLANISHDIKTPLASIRGYVEGILDGVADTPEKLRKYLSTIQRKTGTINDLANNLSLFSRLELSRLEFSFEDGDVREPLIKCLNGLLLDIETAGLALETEISDEPLTVRMDAEKLERVFANLLGNAVKYRRAESKLIKVSAYRDGGFVFVCIKDDGMGIAPEELDKVFESFYRTDASRTSQIKGNGLGLGIAKEIVSRHGGLVWLESEGRDKGTRAIVRLRSL